MNRSVLYVGAALIALMCLFPPFETTRYDGMDAAFGNDPEHTAVEYRFAFVEAEPGPFESVRGQTVAMDRLLLQIIAVALLTGLVGFAVGEEEDEPADA
jgi:hypothetical protein